MTKTDFFPALREFIPQLAKEEIPEERKNILGELIDFIQTKMEKQEVIRLNFICTHNSRRSQLAQVWAATMAAYHEVDVSCFSGGTEVTAFNERAVSALKRIGFSIRHEGEKNPKFDISFSESEKPVLAFSKRYDDPQNPTDKFAAVMTCDKAEATCPFIPGAEKRISLLYEDPGKYDGSVEEKMMYDERSRQIAAEMFYVFSHLKTEK